MHISTPNGPRLKETDTHWVLMFFFLPLQ